MSFKYPQILATLIISIWSAATAAAGDLNGPVLGLVADSSGHALRPIRGIPGAASWGDSVDLGADVSSLAVSPRQNLAVAVTASGVQTVSLAADGTAALSDAGAPADFHPTLIVFSPGGATAALYDGTARALWLAGKAAAPVDISMLPDSIQSLALSDGDDPLIAGMLGSDTTSVFILDSHGNYRLVPSFGNVASIAFVGNGHDLAIADRGAKQLLLIRDPLSGNGPEVRLTLPDDAGGPTAVASSGDGSTLAFLAGGSTVGLLTLAGNQWMAIDCNCTPTSLAPVRGNAVFRLTDAPDQPLWLLDGDSQDPRVTFVPAAAPFEARP